MTTTEAVYNITETMTTAAYNCTVDPSMASFNLTLFALSVTLHIFALFANISVILVYTKAPGLSATQIILRNLAVVDLMYDVVTPFYVYRYVYPYFRLGDQIDYYQAAYMAKYMTPIAHFIAITSTWLVVASNIFRYIASCHIDMHTRVNNPSRAAKVTGIIALACGLWSLIDFIEKYFFPIVVKPCTGYYYFGRDHPLRKHTGYVYTIFALWLIFNHLVPTGIMAFCNFQFALVLKKLKTSVEPEKGRMSAKHQRDLILTVMGVTISFAILTVPAMVEHILWRTEKSYAPLFQRISHTCLLINQIINFLIYTGLNKQFLSLFKACCRVEQWLESSMFTSKNTVATRSGVNGATTTSSAGKP